MTTCTLNDFPYVRHKGLPNKEKGTNSLPLQRSYTVISLSRKKTL